MAEKKMTKKEYFIMIEDIVNGSTVINKDDILSFIAHEKELLDKTSSRSRETKTRKANAIILTTIMEVLADQDHPVTISELMADARLASYVEETKDGNKTVTMTNQKLSSLMKQLVLAEKVVRTEDKRKAFFSLPIDNLADDVV